MYKCEATNKCKELGSGFSTDGRAVASGARDTQFEATLMRHFWTFYLILLRLKTWINKTRLKLPDLKKYYFTSCWKFVGAVPNKILWKGKKWGGASWRNWQCHWKNTDWRSGQLNSNCQTFLVVRCGCWLRGRLWLAISHILNRVQCWKTHVLSLKLAAVDDDELTKSCDRWSMLQNSLLEIWSSQKFKKVYCNAWTKMKSNCSVEAKLSSKTSRYF